MPPSEYRIISKPDLLRKYTDERWEERLTPYQYEDWRFKIKTIRIWKNGNDIMAIVNEYRPPHGPPSTVVRQLRDGDIMYYIP